MAEGYYNHFTNSKSAQSAGVSPFTPHKFDTPHIQAITAMDEEGIDISRQPVRFVNSEMVNEADQIFVMTSQDELPDYILNNPKTVYWPVVDPYGQSPEFVRSVRDQIKDLVNSII